MSETLKIDRRRLLQGSLLAASLGLMPGVPAFGQSPVRLRMYWWGSKERADRTLQAAGLYKARFPNVTIDGETLGWGDYWPRLATQAAGRNMPDVIQMDYRYLFEYARRGGLLALDKFMPDILKIADFGGPATDSGRVDGKLYGVNLGLNSSAVLYSKDAFAKAGIKPMDQTTTWPEFAKLAAELTKAANKPGFFGSADGGGVEPAFEGWLRTRGKSLYTDDKLGFDVADASEWFAMWSEMRKSKSCVPADVQALDKLNPETSMLTLGKSAVAFAHSNQLIAYQTLNKEALHLTMYPNGGPGAKPAHYLKPSQMWSIAATTKFPEEAAKLVNYYVADPEGAKAIGVERGVPASANIRNIVSGDLDTLSKAMVDYVAFVSDKVGALPPPPPKGAGEIEGLLVRVNQQVGFGLMSPAVAGKAYVDEAKSILERG